MVVLQLVFVLAKELYLDLALFDAGLQTEKQIFGYALMISPLVNLR